MKKIKLSEIIIPNVFLQSNPSETKMERCRNKWSKYNKQPKLLIVNEDNVLIDGYIQYLVLKELGYEEGNYLVRHESKKEKSSYRDESTTYIYGVHPYSEHKKEFVWRVPKTWSESGWEDGLSVGDSIFVDTKFGTKRIEITKIEFLDECPIDIPVKRVVKRLD